MRKVTRTTFVVDRPFQLKYTALLAATGVVVSLLFGTMVYLVHADANDSLPQVARQNESVQLALRESERTLVWLICGATVMMGGALTLLGILITHRVAGPLYVMGMYMTQLTQGKYPIVRPLRKHDELKVFFERFQKALEQMRQREIEEANRLDEVIQQLNGAGGVEALKLLRDKKRAATAPPTAAVPAPAPGAQAS
ncbi:MAG: signal protein [Myxococcaceae bacterium]